MPFTQAQFFDVLVRYNQAVWPTQLVLTALAVVMAGLVLRGGRAASTAVSAALALLWAWTALAYHWAYFTAINPAAWAFGALFLVGAASFAWSGVVAGKLDFMCRKDARGWVGGGLVVYALLLYPAVAWLAGHRYPAMPTFGLPCPTTIFTIGVLLFVKDLPRWILVAPLAWATVGSTAAFEFGMHEDQGLIAAGLVGAWMTLPPRRRRPGATVCG
jgi:hypothetical protein